MIFTVVHRPCTTKLAQNISLRNVEVNKTQFQAIFLTSMKTSLLVVIRFIVIVCLDQIKIIFIHIQIKL